MQPNLGSTRVPRDFPRSSLGTFLVSMLYYFIRVTQSTVSKIFQRSITLLTVDSM